MKLNRGWSSKAYGYLRRFRQGKDENEAPGCSPEGTAARHMGIYDGLGKERMEMKLQGAHQRVQQSLGEGRVEKKLQGAQQRRYY